uniref:Uncharacterized protein n=1 Tax=Timema bartmani TaxID=61472 RepID=A0A7R9EY71_9NEOP|nr:unnamed protein product [Timema bartmani]
MSISPHASLRRKIVEKARLKLNGHVMRIEKKKKEMGGTEKCESKRRRMVGGKKKMEALLVACLLLA